MVFPDHYSFTKSEIVKILNYAESNNLKLVMTEKDYFKIGYGKRKKALIDF